jgi:hypothetical protein
VKTIVGVSVHVKRLHENRKGMFWETASLEMPMVYRVNID